MFQKLRDEISEAEFEDANPQHHRWNELANGIGY